MFKLKLFANICEDLMPLYLIAAIALSLTGCSASDETFAESTSQKGEYLYRKHDEHLAIIPPQEKVPPRRYPWTQK